MSLTSGKNLNLLENGAPSEAHYAELMRFFRGVDVLVQPNVISASITAPPGSPFNGDAYIVPTGATGAWAGHDDDIARWSDYLSGGAWEYITPSNGWKAFVENAGLLGQTWVYDGSWSYEFDLPTYVDQSAAAAGGLLAGDLFQKADGSLLVKT